MTDEIRITRTERVPPTARVGHYDELGEPAKQRLSELVPEREATVAGTEVVAAFRGYDHVKFTDYYRVERV